MRFRPTLFRAAAVATAGLLALPATPAVATDTTVVDVLKVVDGEYVVDTVRVPAATAEATAESLEDRADVVVASPSVVYQVEGSPDPYWDTGDPQATSRVRDVWSRTRGEGQVVAVLDTAATVTHDDLIGAVLPGTDMTDGSGDTWHGNGVAGVIAARADNGTGSAGMAPAAKILPVKVCSNGGCTSAAIARGILWAADRGVDVINMSLSGAGYSDVSAAAVQYALDRGISVVASAGNDGLNGNPVMYPAALNGVIGVSSTTPTGAVSDWAVHGWQVDLSTVGESVLLTSPGTGYSNGSGTSFSGPAVAGAVALLRAGHPGITPVQVQAALQAGSDSSGTWDRAYGAGRLDVPAAMAAADRTPAGVVATGSSGAVDVGWDAVPGATTYTVRMDGVVRASVTGTSTRISGLTDGNQVAVDVQADAGPRSRPVLVTVAPTMPAVPTLHSASLSGTSTSATLTLNASVSGAPASTYSIIRDGVSIGTIPWALTGSPASKAIGIGAMPSTQVRWQLRAVDSYAQVGAASNTVTTGTTVPAPPGAPTGLTGRILDGKALLQWNDLGSAVTYRVSVGGSVVATPSTAGVTLPAPAVGASRTYEVAVVDGFGQTGPAASTTVTRTLTVPAAPAMGAPTVSYGTVTARWQAPADDGGSPITGYTVRAWKDGSVAATATAEADTGSAALVGLTLGTAYTVTVSATNAVGAGSPSAPVEVVPISTPGAPVLGAVTPGDGSVVVRWTAPTANGGTPITGYKLEARLSGSYALVASTTAGADATTATLAGLANGTSHVVYLYALNAAGTGAGTTRSGVTPRAAAVAPAAPLLGTVTRADRGAVVRWTAPADDGGSAVTGYVIRTFQGATALATTTAPAGTTIANVLGLTNGTTYTFSVAAVNAVGTGPDSTRSTAVTPQPVGTAPSAPLIGNVTVGNGSVVVSWTPPASDGGSALTGYTVRVHEGGGVSRAIGVPPEELSTTVTGLTNGTAYEFSVTASNGAGTSAASARSRSVTPRPAATVPGAPVLGSVAGGNGSVTVEWSAPDDDGGTPITGYVVEVWSYGSLWTSAVVPATPTRATLDGLANGVPYTVVVAATNDTGTGSSSAPGAEVTPALPPAVAPSAPAIGTPTTYQAAARVRWSTPADDGGSPLTGYEVRAYRGGVLVKKVTAPATVTSVAVTGLMLGRAHTFTVAAVNAAGTGSESARSSAVTPRMIPGAPKVSSVTAARKAVVVKWAAPASNGGAAISGYVVRTYAGGRLVTATSVRATARSVTVTGLTAGRSYTFRVQAKNAVGGSALSAASKSVKPTR